MITADLHTHTCISPDATHSLRTMVRKAKKTGLDAIAITDHNHLLDYRIAQELSREFDILVIPGMEGGKIAREKHWIALGVDSVPQGRSIFQILDSIHDMGGIAIAPHPMTCKGYHSFSALPFDAVETLNGTTPIANAFLKNPVSMPEVGGSDAHSSCMLGYTWTEIERDCSCIDDLLLAIEKGSCRPGGSLVPAWKHLVFWGQLGLRYLDQIGTGIRKKSPSVSLFSYLNDEMIHDEGSPYTHD
ncbi:MAG: PHP domain-containing protein [Methanospirillaceae archaeon]|nr:PHP domain-containing protein [Methanospirillaceae archaeon]